MPKISLRQKKLAELTLENAANDNKKTKGQLLKDAGYSEAMSTVPSRIFDSPGFKMAMKELAMSLNIDKNARIMKLAQMFWETKKVKDAVEINKELSKMMGDYAPTTTEIRGLRDERETIIVKPE